MRILLIDADTFREAPENRTAYYSHHPVGLLYLVSSALIHHPELEFRVFHTATSTEPEKALKELLESFRPALTGLRSLSAARETFAKMSATIRAWNAGVPIVAGGPYPSASFDEILKTRLADLVVIGEGEVTFSELMTRMKQDTGLPHDLAGTAVLQEGEVRLNPPRPLIADVDAIPFPDYSKIRLSDYHGILNHSHGGASSSAFLLCSRGCPYNCFFCHQLFGKKIRKRSPASIVSEMRSHIEERGIHDFIILDDLFNVPMDGAKDLLRSISRELPAVRLNFPNGLRSDHIDEEMIDLFEAAGTVQMSLAVESASPRIQKIIGKNMDVEKAAKAIHLATQRFISRLYFIVGFPGETYDEAMETIRYAESFRYAAQPMLSVLRVYQNSRILDILKPDAEQMAAIERQENKLFHLEIFQQSDFYGDLFPPEKVPLKSADLKELLMCWMRDVLIHPERIRRSHEVVSRHLTHEKILEFYRGIFNKPAFSDHDLQKLLNTPL